MAPVSCRRVPPGGQRREPHAARHDHEAGRQEARDVRRAAALLLRRREEAWAGALPGRQRVRRAVARRSWQWQARPLMATYAFPTDRVHYKWDTGNEPVLRIASGDTVTYETRDVSDDQITPESAAGVVATRDGDRVYPLAGPVAVEGAEPGDTLVVEILDIHVKGWGWTAILPGFGLLADDFTEPYLRTFDLSLGDRMYFRDDIVIPLEPFFGTMGVCPAGASAQSIMPPGIFGGNLDTRQLIAGTTLYLPVYEKGALFSCGDA